MQRQTAASSIYPLSVEKVFQRLSNIKNNQRIENILLDLDTLFGKTLVKKALHLIDFQTIVVYTCKPKTIEIAEVSEIGSSPRLVRLFKNLNYCTCNYFRYEVLLLTESTSGPYTCKHVLALRLALILEHKCLEIKEVTSHQLDLLLKYFFPDNTSDVTKY